jgi:predicted nucleotidyltransferase
MRMMTTDWLDELIAELATADEVGWLVSSSIARGEAHAYSDIDLTRFTSVGPSTYRERYGLRY